MPRPPQEILPWRLTWNIIMEVWKIIFLSRWVICRFHVNLPGCSRHCKGIMKSCLSLNNHSIRSYFLVGVGSGDWKAFRPCFGGLTFKNRGQLGSRYINIYVYTYICICQWIYIYIYNIYIFFLWAIFWGNINGDRPKKLESYLMDWKKLFQPVLRIVSNP